MASEEQVQEQITEYSPSATAIDLTEKKDGGLLKEILQDGSSEGSPLTGDTVAVHYTGTLLDGTKFDSSRDRDEVFHFELGKGKVIRGWDVGVASMKKGELARLICKSEYAYGENGSPPAIPPNATLIFEVELFSWKGTDISPEKTGEILKSVLKAGTGDDQPNEFASVEVAIVGRHDGRVFTEKEARFVQGEGAEQGVVEGIDIAVKEMKKDEVARLVIAPMYGYGSLGHEEYKIPADATLEYDVTLKAFERIKESWEMDAGEKLEQADQMKQMGTGHFKNSKYASAKKCYQKVVEYLDSEDGLQEEEKAQRNALLLSGYLNLAMCDLKLQENLDVVKSCDSALELDGKNEKAYFRRGTARLALHCFEEALEDFNKVLEISPDNKAARNQITLTKNKIKTAKDKEKKLFNNMFQRFADMDSKKEDQDRRNQDALSQIGDWDNEMARGFLPLDKEVEAFGEKMPEPKYMQASKENVDPAAGDGGSDIEG